MITGGQVGPVAHLVKAELYNALILLGIPYRCKSDGFDYEKAVTEGLNSRTGKRLCTQTDHPYQTAWVRLNRRAVMNTYVNQTGLLPFEIINDGRKINVKPTILERDNLTGKEMEVCP